MKGLLRKYKITQISDTVKLSEPERLLCEYLYDTFSDLKYFKNSNNVYRFSSDKTETEFIYYKSMTNDIVIKFDEQIKNNIISKIIDIGVEDNLNYNRLILEWVSDICGLEDMGFSKPTVLYLARYDK